MVDTIFGSSEPSALTGTKAPKMGHHLMPRQGGVAVLAGAVADVVREQAHRIRANATWKEYSSATLSIADPNMASNQFDPMHVLKSRYALALALLRDYALSSAYRLKEGPHRLYAWAQGDTPGTEQQVSRLLAAVQEACDDSGYDLHATDLAPLIAGPEE